MDCYQQCFYIVMLYLSVRNYTYIVWLDVIAFFCPIQSQSGLMKLIESADKKKTPSLNRCVYLSNWTKYFFFFFFLLYVMVWQLRVAKQMTGTLAYECRRMYVLTANSLAKITAHSVQNNQLAKGTVLSLNCCIVRCRSVFFPPEIHRRRIVFNTNVVAI